MGHESRTRISAEEAQAQADRIREMVVGEVKPFGIHDHSCTKCGSKERPEKQWCAGFIALLPAEVTQPCKSPGEHLHGRCLACKYTWRESVAP